MIHEVDEALRALVRNEALEGAGVTVVFDAPTRDWAAKVNAPTVNLYLYDIREDMRRRERGLHNEYDDHGVVVARHLPPRYFKLSYLITAWTRRAEDEHRLLSSLLSCLLQYEAMPERLLTGTLGELGLAVPLTLALPPPEDRSFADVWSALGGELKPSLDVVVSVPIRSSSRIPVGPAAQSGVRLGVDGSVPPHSSGTPPTGYRPFDGPLPARDRRLARAAAAGADANGSGRNGVAGSTGTARGGADRDGTPGAGGADAAGGEGAAGGGAAGTAGAGAGRADGPGGRRARRGASTGTATTGAAGDAPPEPGSRAGAAGPEATRAEGGDGGDATGQVAPPARRGLSWRITEDRRP